jgi:hypothetical protein
MWTKRVLLCRILNDNDVAQGHLDHNQMPYIPKSFGSRTGFGGLSGCNKHGDPSVLSTNRKLEHIRQSWTNVAAQNPQDIWILNRKRHLKNHIQWGLLEWGIQRCDTSNFITRINSSDSDTGTNFYSQVASVPDPN